VVDISAAALRRAQDRLPDVPITWIEADIAADWQAAPVDIWHDRAAFHFLTSAIDRARYVEHLKAILKPGGQAIMATFGPNGPTRCSGLSVARYSPEVLAKELGPPFRLVEAALDMHQTPLGSTQEFWYSRLLREE
jgi:SAM-dependent methyltransferase